MLNVLPTPRKRFLADHPVRRGLSARIGLLFDSLWPGPWVGASPVVVVIIFFALAGFKMLISISLATSVELQYWTNTSLSCFVLFLVSFVGAEGPGCS